MSIPLKSKEEIEIMRRANLIVHRVHQELAKLVQPGVTTGDLDARAREILKEENVKPAFLGYPSNTKGVAPFPGVICSSVNDEIVHGIPGKRKLIEGDIVSIDFGCELDGFFGDAAVTHGVGAISESAQSLLEVTEKSLEDALKQCQAGNRIGDISAAVQRRVESEGFFSSS